MLRTTGRDDPIHRPAGEPDAWDAPRARPARAHRADRPQTPGAALGRLAQHTSRSVEETVDEFRNLAKAIEERRDRSLRRTPGAAERRAAAPSPQPPAHAAAQPTRLRRDSAQADTGQTDTQRPALGKSRFARLHEALEAAGEAHQPAAASAPPSQDAAPVQAAALAAPAPAPAAAQCKSMAQGAAPKAARRALPVDARFDADALAHMIEPHILPAPALPDAVGLEEGEDEPTESWLAALRETIRASVDAAGSPAGEPSLRADATANAAPDLAALAATVSGLERRIAILEQSRRRTRVRKVTDVPDPLAEMAQSSAPTSPPATRTASAQGAPGLLPRRLWR